MLMVKDKWVKLEFPKHPAIEQDPKKFVDECRKFISENKDHCYGELQHPRDFEIRSLNIRDISHRVDKVSDDGTKVSIHLYETPQGKIAQDMVEHDIPLRIVPRMTYDEKSGDVQILSMDISPIEQ